MCVRACMRVCVCVAVAVPASHVVLPQETIASSGIPPPPSPPSSPACPHLPPSFHPTPSHPSSSPLGLPRKRSGSSTSPLTHPKRKQQSVHAFPNDFDSVEKEEEFPLINFSPSATSFSPHQVEEEVASLTTRLAAVMNMKEDWVECLLVLCSWNKDLLLQAWPFSSSSLLLLLPFLLFLLLFLFLLFFQLFLLLFLLLLPPEVLY